MDMMQPFTDPAMVARYVQDTPRKVPGFADLHRMAMLLLAERAPATANILVVGAGGGLEIKAFAEAQAQWRFVGVDPSIEMLNLARHIIERHQSRIALLHGYVETAPPGPFDGATCLLTLHFLAKDERLRVLREIRRRLKPGAPFAVAHHSHPVGADLRRWLSWSTEFASGPCLDFEQAQVSASLMAERLSILSVDEDEALLCEAGFSGVALFYAGFSFRGWIATA